MNEESKSKLSERPADEEAYIFDTLAANFDVQIATPELMTAVCAGQLQCCELCGAQFPLWPLKPWAVHWIQDHANDITLQQHMGVSQLATEEVTPAVLQYMGAQILTRVGMRRNARDLGLIRFKRKLDFSRRPQ